MNGLPEKANVSFTYEITAGLAERRRRGYIRRGTPLVGALRPDAAGKHPMQPEARVLDIGFGTGFPLIELAQRFGADSKVYGMDVWTAGVARARKRIEGLALSNIEIFEQSAAAIPLPDGSIDLVTANLGINNFADKQTVYREILRVLRPGGSLCITTNPQDTFAEFFTLFRQTLQEHHLADLVRRLDQSVDRRSDRPSVCREFEASGMQLTTYREDRTTLRFADAAAVFDHGLIRIGFRPEWEALIPDAHQEAVFTSLLRAIQTTIAERGEFVLSIPMLYLQFTPAPTRFADQK